MSDTASLTLPCTRLPRLDCGSLTIILPNGRPILLEGRTEGPSGTVTLHRWRTLRRVALGGDVGFAEAYVDGDWSSPDLPTLLETMTLNQSTLPGAEGGPWLSRLLNRLRHLARANTMAGSRRNIVQHYDLGNDFYSRWLDRGMSYSSALFHSPDMDLEAAQTAKQDQIMKMLDVRRGQAALEIGIGWGGVAERLASAKARVTGVTLSPSQLAYAKERLTERALPADLRLQDYREIEGGFDRIVSIEMLEAVGEKWWPVYFEKLRTLLAPDGVIVLQTITIADERFSAYRRTADFIQRHIFPGGMLPSPSALRAEIDRAGLVVEAVETFGASYARTLELWRERFEQAWPEIAAMGFAPRFKRLWDYYLAYCEAGFRAGAVDVGLWQLRRQS